MKKNNPFMVNKYQKNKQHIHDIYIELRLNINSERRPSFGRKDYQFMTLYTKSVGCVLIDNLIWENMIYLVVVNVFKLAFFYPCLCLNLFSYDYTKLLFLIIEVSAHDL